MLDRKEHEGCVLSANQSVAGDGARPITRRRYAPLLTIGATPGSHKPGDNNCSSGDGVILYLYDIIFVTVRE